MTANEDKISRVRAEIRSITVNSRLVPSLNGKPVKIPNWEPGVDLNDNGGSKRPGVFEIGSPQSKGLAVDILIDGMEPKESGLLVGTLENTNKNNHIIFSGKIKNCDTVQSVTVLPQPESGNFNRLIGDMKWHLKFSDGQVFRIPRTTRMEIYWIFHYPAKMYHRRGVWIEVLRLLNQICPDAETKDNVIRRVVLYCHSRAGVRYDSFYGSCYFTDGPEGGLFKLKAFLDKVISVCDCYDQAGAVQTLLGAVGIKVDWLYMQPFGFINIARLAGRGKCNNPFFLSESGEPYVAAKIVPKNDPKRTGFYNHAFCNTKKGRRIVILDACVGPHLGDESEEQYIEKSIDTETILYDKDGIPCPGTIKDIKKYPGILYVDVLGCEKPEEKRSRASFHEDRRVKEFIERTGFDACGKNPESEQGVVCDWGKALDDLEKEMQCPELKLGKLEFDDTRFGCYCGVLERIYRKNKEKMRIEIFVSNKGIEAAKERLLKIAAATTMDKIPFRKNPEKLGQLCLTANIHNREKAICVFHNICFLVEAHNSAADVLHVLRRLCTVAQNNIVDNLSDYVPKIKQVVVSPHSQKIKIGEDVNMDIIPAQYPASNLLLVFLIEGDSLIFEHEEFYSEETNKGSLRFRRKSPGVTRVFPILANWQTLLCSTQEVKITVA